MSGPPHLAFAGTAMFVLVGLALVLLAGLRPQVGPSGAAPTGTATALAATDPSPTPTLFRRSAPPGATSQPEVTAIPTPSGTPYDQPLPAELTTALADVHWSLPADDGGWLVGDYAGRVVHVDLPALASFDLPRQLVTAAAVEGTDEVFYDVDPATGAVHELARVPTGLPELIDTRSPGGGRLYFARSFNGQDGGVERIDLATGTRTTIVGGDAAPDHDRILLIWSTSGRTLLSSLCDASTCNVDLIDDATGAARRLPNAFSPVAASDRFLLGYRSAQGPDRPWAIDDLATDTVRTVASTWIAETDAGVMLPDGTAIVSGPSADQQTYDIVRVDPVSGKEQLVLAQPYARVVGRLDQWVAGSRWVVVNAQPVWSELAAGGGRVDVLDLGTGDLLPGAAAIGHP